MLKYSQVTKQILSYPLSEVWSFDFALCFVCIILPLFLPRHALLLYYSIHHSILKSACLQVCTPLKKTRKLCFFFSFFLALCLVQYQHFLNELIQNAVTVSSVRPQTLSAFPDSHWLHSYLIISRLVLVTS